MPFFIAKPWAFFCIVLLWLVTALRRDNFTMTYFLVITGTVSRGCAQLLCFFGPSTFSDGRLAEQMRGLAWFTGRVIQSSGLPLPFILRPPSSVPPPPLLPVSPSGNHELHGFQAQVSDFRCLGNVFAWVILQQ